MPPEESRGCHRTITTTAEKRSCCCHGGRWPRSRRRQNSPLPPATHAGNRGEVTPSPDFIKPCHRPTPMLHRRKLTLPPSTERREIGGEASPLELKTIAAALYRRTLPENRGG
nr:hypothetical protein Itr_chr15CG10740 [Ipomoea trifida]